MADPSFDTKARAIARAVADEFENRGIGLSFDEAKQVAASMNSGIELFCAGCGHELSSEEATAEKCGLCGSRKAVDRPVYRCGNPRCTSPVSIKQEACLKCGSKEAINYSWG